MRKQTRGSSYWLLNGLWFYAQALRLKAFDKIATYNNCLVIQCYRFIGIAFFISQPEYSDLSHNIRWYYLLKMNWWAPFPIQFIKELKPHYQEVIQLRYLPELSEIANKTIKYVKIKLLSQNYFSRNYSEKKISKKSTLFHLNFYAVHFFRFHPNTHHLNTLLDVIFWLLFYIIVNSLIEVN
jgi:hypothetical protein